MDATSYSVLEQRLLEIWSSVLGRDNIQLDDDFLKIGGDSLSAMVCISRIHIEFGLMLEVEDFFIEPATVASLASILNRLRLTNIDRAGE